MDKDSILLTPTLDLNSCANQIACLVNSEHSLTHVKTRLKDS